MGGSTGSVRRCGGGGRAAAVARYTAFHAAAAHYSFYPQMSQFVSEFCVGPNLAPPPAANSTLPQTFCRRRVAASAAAHPRPNLNLLCLAVQQRQSAAAQMPQRGASLLLAALVQRLPALHVCHTLQAFQCGCRCPSPHAICIASARLRCAIRSRKGAQLPPSPTPSRFLISCSLLKRVAAACTIVSSCRVTAAAARITQPAAADTAHAISHDGVVLVRGGCGCWHASI